jgi:uncharacterized membrane protein YdfJ with MMPL/SSD domain
MNMLSSGAAFGGTTAVFQNGFLDPLVGVSRTAPIQPLVPVLMFAVLFGLKMDYEVFLASRMRPRRPGTRHGEFSACLSGRGRLSRGVGRGVGQALGRDRLRLDADAGHPVSRHRYVPRADQRP